MAIPDFQSLMLPLLRSLADGSERSTQETLDALAEELGLTEADVTQPMPMVRHRLASSESDGEAPKYSLGSNLEADRKALADGFFP